MRWLGRIGDIGWFDQVSHYSAFSEKNYWIGLDRIEKGGGGGRVEK